MAKYLPLSGRHTYSPLGLLSLLENVRQTEVRSF